MSYDDFSRCTPEEFTSICEAYNRHDEAHSRESWERMRLLATVMIQPHTKKKITPLGLLLFPWDKKEDKKKEPEISKEESRLRFETIVKRL